MAGRSESTYRYTVIDTIGGGSSEIQKNILARRKLGLPEELLSARHPVTAPPASSAAAPTGPATGARPGRHGARWPGWSCSTWPASGPAARCTRVLADYGATVVKVGTVPGQRRRAHPAAVLRLQRRPAPPPRGLRPEGRRRARAPSSSWSAAPTWWSRASGPAWSTAWASASTRCAPSTPGSSCARPPATARTGPGRRGPATTSTTWPWAATWPPPSRRPTAGRRCPGATIADAAGGGMQAALAVMAALVGRGDGRSRRPPRRVDRRRGPVAHLAGRRRVPGHRGPGRLRPQHHHRPVRLLRHLPVRRRPVGGRRGHRAQVLRQPVPAARLRAVGRPASSTTRSRTPSGPTSPPPSPPGTATPGWPTLAGADTCVSPVLTVAELVDDEQYRARRAIVEATLARRRTGRRGAGHLPPGRAGAGRDARGRGAGGGRRPGPVGHRGAVGGGRRAGRPDRRAADEGSGGMSAIGIDDIEGVLGVGQYEEEGEFPVEQGLHLDHLLVGGERQPALLGRRGGRAR